MRPELTIQIALAAVLGAGVKNTIAASAWCNHCRRTTLHVVSGNRIGRCAEHDAPQLSKAQLDRRRRANQGALFQDKLE